MEILLASFATFMLGFIAYIIWKLTSTKKTHVLWVLVVVSDIIFLVVNPGWCLVVLVMLLMFALLSHDDESAADAIFGLFLGQIFFSLIVLLVALAVILP